jgi:hypothetical protein
MKATSEIRARLTHQPLFLPRLESDPHFWAPGRAQWPF